MLHYNRLFNEKVFFNNFQQNNSNRFRWTLYKTLEFMHFRRPDLEIRANFFNQLVRLENKLTKLGFGAKTFNWNEIGSAYKVTSEELLLTNTFLNAQKKEKK